jgi:hypothetical protein
MGLRRPRDRPPPRPVSSTTRSFRLKRWRSAHRFKVARRARARVITGTFRSMWRRNGSRRPDHRLAASLGWPRRESATAVPPSCRTLLSCISFSLDHELSFLSVSRLQAFKDQFRRSKYGLTWDEVELRGLEPLASCMPCLANPSGIVRGGQGGAGQNRFDIWRGPESTGMDWARSHLVSHFIRGMVGSCENPGRYGRGGLVPLPRLRLGFAGSAGVGRGRVGAGRP